MVILCLVLATQYAHKASQQRSAFVRWRAAVLDITHGADVYGGGYQFPNPPIMALILQPFARLPVVPGALLWFFAKVAMTVAAAVWTFQLVRDGRHPISGWAALAAVLLSLRPIMSDLSHGNVNLFILFLVVGSLHAYRAGWDRTSGLAVALATACKVTPALLCVYWIYKRAWRTAAWSGIGLMLFLVAVPSVFLGPQRNARLLGDWTDLMIKPFVMDGRIWTEEINQSIAGVMTRLLSDVESVNVGGGVKRPINVAAVDPTALRWWIRGAGLAVLATLAITCRTPTGRRDQWRLSCEYGLVLLAMLFLSERSWKHHYVTLLVPYAAICYALAAPALSRSWRVGLTGTSLASALLMATTSREIGEALLGPLGHKYAQGYGAFLWAGIVVFTALAILMLRGPTHIATTDRTSSDRAFLMRHRRRLGPSQESLGVPERGSAGDR